jgi:DNA repair exonuclease SbcCD nuclease subunit
LSKATLGFFTDAHLRGVTPTSRKDSYPESTLKKFGYCVERCSDECDFMVFGGDLTHTHKLSSDDVKERTIQILANSEKEFFYTFGQHDLQGHDYGTRGSSTSDFIFRIARMIGSELSEIPPEEDLLFERNGIKFSIIACPSGYEPESWSKKYAAKRPNNVDFRICIAHQFLTTDDCDWFVHVDTFTTKSDDQDELGFDLVLSGDLHDGFKPHVNKHGTLFINPGSLARTKKTKHDVDRPIQGVDVTFTKTDKKKELKHEFWPVKTALPAADVFKEDAPVIGLDGKETEVESKNVITGEENFDEVVNKLQKVGTAKVNVWDILENQAKKEKLDKDVHSYVFSKRPSE